MGSGDPPLYGSAHGGRSPTRLYVKVPLPGPPRGDPGGCMRAPCLDSDTRTNIGEEELGLSAPLA